MAGSFFVYTEPDNPKDMKLSREDSGDRVTLTITWEVSRGMFVFMTHMDFVIMYCILVYLNKRIADSNKRINVPL